MGILFWTGHFSAMSTKNILELDIKKHIFVTEMSMTSLYCINFHGFSISRNLMFKSNVFSLVLLYCLCFNQQSLCHERRLVTMFSDATSSRRLICVCSSWCWIIRIHGCQVTVKCSSTGTFIAHVIVIKHYSAVSLYVTTLYYFACVIIGRGNKFLMLYKISTF